MNHKNLLLEKVKKDLLHRGQYQEVDQKCQSFKSFINLMDTNQLFKELRTDPRKVTGDLNRDMQKAANGKGTFQNTSIYTNSIHMHSESEAHGNRAASNIADMMIGDLAKAMGIPNPKSQLSDGHSSSFVRSRKGTFG